MGRGFRSVTAKEYHQMVKRQVIRGYHSWPGKIEFLSTTAVLPTFPLWISTSTAALNLSSLKVLLSSGQGGTWP